MGESPSQFDDRFLLHLRRLVFEQSHLWELRAETIILEDSNELEPWSPHLCSLPLLGWLDAGLLGLYRELPDTNEIEDLPIDEARSVLQDMAGWRSGTTAVLLVPTDEGEAASYDTWRQTLKS